MTNAAIRTERLSKDYGAGRAVFDLDLVIERGEVFGFLGPNGARAGHARSLRPRQTPRSPGLWRCHHSSGFGANTVTIPTRRKHAELAERVELRAA